jgi:hypothetical protein
MVDGRPMLRPVSTVAGSGSVDSTFFPAENPVRELYLSIGTTFASSEIITVSTSRSVAVFIQTKLVGGLAIFAISAGTFTQIVNEKDSTNSAAAVVAASAARTSPAALATAERPTQAASGASVSDTDAPDFASLQRVLDEAENASVQYTNYTATLELQEDLQGSLQPSENIKVKMRRAPFSVYMRWESKDQEAIFVEGQNNNRMLVRPTKALATLRRVWRLDPESRMAKQNCRYPVTDSGLEKLVTQTKLFYANRTDWANHVKCHYSADNVGGVDVTVFNAHFARAASPDFSHSRYFFDDKRGLMIGVENYGWTADDKEGLLVERYVYHAIDSKVALDDKDFDHENPEYSFVAR